MRYFEDYVPGDVFTGGPVTLHEEDVIRFASSFDPQPFHTEPERAKALFFGELVASGWYTAAVCMRMVVESELGSTANGLVGLEVKHMRWPVPTRPGDTLRLVIEVVDARPSGSRRGWGVVQLRLTASNQRQETVLVAEHALWVARRHAGTSRHESSSGSAAEPSRS